MKKLADAEELVVRIPVVAVGVEVQVPITVVLVDDERVVQAAPFYAKKRPCHYPSNTLGIESNSGTLSPYLFAPSIFILGHTARILTADVSAIIPALRI